MDLQEIKSRIFKDSKGNNVYMNVSVEEMDWLVEIAEKSGAVHSRYFLMDTIEKQQKKIEQWKKVNQELVSTHAKRDKELRENFKEHLKGIDIALLIYEWAKKYNIHPDDFDMLFAHELLEKLEEDDE